MNDTLREIQLHAKIHTCAVLEHIKDELKDGPTPKLPLELLVDDVTRKRLETILSELNASMYAAVAKQTEAIQKEIEDLRRLGASKMLPTDLD